MLENLNLESVQGYFSVAVAAFLLLRLETDIRKLTVAIERLRSCQVCVLKDRPRSGEGKSL